MGTDVICPLLNLLAVSNISTLYCLAVDAITRIGSSRQPGRLRIRNRALDSTRVEFEQWEAIGRKVHIKGLFDSVVDERYVLGKKII